MDPTDPNKLTPIQIAVRKALLKFEAGAAADPDGDLATPIRMNQALEFSAALIEKSREKQSADADDQLRLFPG